jgi:hypothetical protein
MCNVGSNISNKNWFLDKQGVYENMKWYSKNGEFSRWKVLELAEYATVCLENRDG